MLVNVGTDWLRRLAAHDAPRVRVTAYPESVASDEFNLQNARIPGRAVQEQETCRTSAIFLAKSGVRLNELAARYQM